MAHVGASLGLSARKQRTHGNSIKEESSQRAPPFNVLGPWRNDLSVRHALSSLLCLVDSGLTEKDALIAPMTMGVKEPRAF